MGVLESRIRGIYFLDPPQGTREPRLRSSPYAPLGYDHKILHSSPKALRQGGFQKPWFAGSLSPYYTILYYTILYHTILYYTILYYTILYYTILYYTILYYTILYYTILYYTILYYTILYYTILYYTTLYYAMLCYAMLCYAMLCYAMLCYAMLCYAMLCYAMLCYAMLCYAMLCYAMLCYAMLCYAMLCYAMLCYAMLCYASEDPGVCLVSWGSISGLLGTFSRRILKSSACHSVPVGFRLSQVRKVAQPKKGPCNCMVYIGASRGSWNLTLRFTHVLHSDTWTLWASRNPHVVVMGIPKALCSCIVYTRASKGLPYHNLGVYVYNTI